MNKKTEEEMIDRIAKTIDPNNTFLEECKEITKERLQELKK